MYKRIASTIVSIKNEYDYWPTTTMLWERFPEYANDSLKIALFKKMIVLMRDVNLIVPVDNGETVRLTYNPINKEKKIELLKRKIKEEISSINKISINSIKQINLFNFDDEEE